VGVPAALASRRRAAIAGIFLVNSLAALHLCWVGVRSRRSRWTVPALLAALGEVAVLVANRRRCPLTGLAERLGAKSGRVSTIFLLRWYADRIPPHCGPPLAIGLLGLLVTAWRRARAEGWREQGAQGAFSPRPARQPGTIDPPLTRGNARRYPARLA
jgi:hypothetical protein